MSNKYDALVGALNNVIDIIKNLPDYEKKGSEGKREPQGGWGVRRDKGSVGLTDDPEILKIIKEKKSKKKKSCAHNCEEPDCEHKPKNPCPFWTNNEEIKCTDSYCMFGDFWAIYPRKSSRKRAHQAWARCTLKLYPEKILKDVADRKLRHSYWLKDHGKYINHAATYLNQALWNDPILDEITQHEQRPSNQKLSPRTAQILRVRQWTKQSLERDIS